LHPLEVRNVEQDTVILINIITALISIQLWIVGGFPKKFFGKAFYYILGLFAKIGFVSKNVKIGPSER
jgi:hypothetical protein